MRRALILLLWPTVAAADELPVPEPIPEVGENPGSSVGDQELGASVGAALGGGNTPGGLRIAGDYLYQLSDLDWFDGIAQFTFGGGGAACFRDRANDTICDHGVGDGMGIDLGGGVRRFFAGQQDFRPWARVAAGLRLSRYGDDDQTGAGLWLSASGGIRVRVTETLAVGAQVTLEGAGVYYNKDLGLSLEDGFSVGGTVDFALP